MWNELIKILEEQAPEQQLLKLEKLLGAFGQFSPPQDLLLSLGLFDPSLRSYCWGQIFAVEPSELLIQVKEALQGTQPDFVAVAQLMSESQGIKLDSENNVIYRPGQAPMLSVPLVRLIFLLSSKSTATFAEILSFCFEISPYEQSIHAMKIHNLLFRAREILGREALYSRREIVVVRDLPSELQIIQPPRFQKTLASSEAWKRLRHILYGQRIRTRRSSLERVLESLEQSQPLARLHLQALTRLSKSSLVRHLKELQEAGKVMKDESHNPPLYFLAERDLKQ